MCFYINKQEPKEKTATRNIRCWKTMSALTDGVYFSAWQLFAYKLGGIYNLGKDLALLPDCNVITEGFHSFSTLDMAWWDRGYKEEVIACSIPKGAHYYYNSKNHEYVSDSIKIIKVER